MMTPPPPLKIRMKKELSWQTTMPFKSRPSTPPPNGRRVGHVNA
jgi:hypothetical protein